MFLNHNRPCRRGLGPHTINLSSPVNSLLTGSAVIYLLLLLICSVCLCCNQHLCIWLLQYVAASYLTGKELAILLFMSDVNVVMSCVDSHTGTLSEIL